MGRPKGSKNKKKGEITSNNGISILEETEVIKERIIPVLIYDTNNSRTKGIEKRIRSLINRHKGFFLQTNILEEYSKYYIDVGNWAWAKENHKYGKVVGHVKNLLPFLGGSNPIWKQKRTYTRHNVKRGIHIG